MKISRYFKAIVAALASGTASLRLFHPEFVQIRRV